MKHLKKYEDGEVINGYYKNAKYYCDWTFDDARAFGYYEDKMYVGYDQNQWHCFLVNDDELYRQQLDYPGRMWMTQKIISFWYYPPIEKMKQVLTDIKIRHNEIRDKEYNYQRDGKIRQGINKDEEINWNGWLIEIIDGMNKLVPLLEYIGSDMRDEEDMGKAHLDWKLKAELKKKGWGKGFGSDMTAWDGKNPLAWRQAKYQESNKFIKSFKLFESPNNVIDFMFNGKPVNISWEEGVAFSYYNDEYVSSYYDTHSNLFHEWIEQNPDVLSDDKKDDYYNKNGRGECAGRYFTNIKLITFWRFPKDNDEMKKLADDIWREEKLNIWRDEWKVEVLIDEEQDMRDGYHYDSNAPVEYISVPEYKMSKERDEEELEIPHLMNWKEKQELKKKGWGKGFGSDITAWDGKNPLAWRQAKYVENIITKYEIFKKI